MLKLSGNLELYVRDKQCQIFRECLSKHILFVSQQKILEICRIEKAFLHTGNLELYVRDKRDAAILFAIQHRKSIDEANDLLEAYSVRFSTENP